MTATSPDSARTVRPLRGRVVIRPDRPTQIGRILLPDMTQDWQREAERSQGIKARSSHTGTVVAMGPPALSKRGREIPHGFGVGDRVQFIWRHNEIEYTKPWTDGLPVAWVSQECILGVIER